MYSENEDGNEEIFLATLARRISSTEDAVNNSTAAMAQFRSPRIKTLVQGELNVGASHDYDNFYENVDDRASLSSENEGIIENRFLTTPNRRFSTKTDNVNDLSVAMAQLKSPSFETVIRHEIDVFASSSQSYHSKSMTKVCRTSPSFVPPTPRLGGVRTSQLDEYESIAIFQDNQEVVVESVCGYKIFQSKNLPNEERSNLTTKINNWMSHTFFSRNPQHLSSNASSNDSFSDVDMIADTGEEKSDFMIDVDVESSTSTETEPRQNVRKSTKRDYCVKVGTLTLNTARIKTCGVIDNSKREAAIKLIFRHDMGINCPLKIDPLIEKQHHQVCYVYCLFNRVEMAWKLEFTPLAEPSSTIMITSTRCNMTCPHKAAVSDTESEVSEPGKSSKTEKKQETKNAIPESDTLPCDKDAKQKKAGKKGEEEEETYNEEFLTHHVHRHYPELVGCDYKLDNKGIYVKGKHMRDTFTEKITQFMLKDLGVRCSVKIGPLHKNKNATIAYRCYVDCAFSEYKSWRLYFTPFDQDSFSQADQFDRTISTVTVSVTHTRPCDHCDEPVKGHQLRGRNRDRAKEILRTVDPVLLMRRDARTVDEELACDGNLLHVHSLGTYQKVASEDNHRFHKPLLSYDQQGIIAAFNDELKLKDRFLRDYIHPITVHMYSEEQLDAVENLVFVHIDSTGNIARTPNGVVCNKTQLYSITGQIDSVTVPIAEMLTSNHKRESISDFLRRYVTFVESSNRKLPIAKVAVTDWSWALIHAVLENFSKTDILSYLQKTYDIAMGYDSEPIDFMLLYTCCFHNIKRMRENLKKINPNERHEFYDELSKAYDVEYNDRRNRRCV